MTLRELFPAYPFILKSPSKAKVKFGTRNLYVDLPWQAYYFLQQTIDKAVKTELRAKEVKEEWRKFLQDNKDTLTLHDKPFVSVSLRSMPFSDKSFLRLDVEWNLFIKYLENKAMNFLAELEKNGKNIMKVYKDIWVNFFSITGVIMPSEPQYFPSTREKFRKLLKRTKDYHHIKNLLDQFEAIMKHVEETMKNEIPSIRLYTTNLIMNIQHLRTLIDVINIPSAYLLLRNLLENFVKMFVYLNVGKSVEPNLVLNLMFVYEYEKTEKIDSKEQRIYSLEKFTKIWTRKVLKIVSSISLDKPVDLLELISKFREKQIPTLGVNPRVLNEFSKNHELKANLDTIYSACSSIIHNQPPLPFFSLLEVKFFRLFLEKYIECLQNIAEKLTGSKIEVKPSSFILETESFHKQCLMVAYNLWMKHNFRMKSMIKRALKEVKGFWVRPSVVAAIFHILSPSFTHLKKHSFTQEDLKDVIERLQPISFRIGLDYEVRETLNAFQEILIPKLEKYEAFSSLQSKDQKMLSLFYLLLLCLPQVIEEMVRKDNGTHR